MKMVNGVEVTEEHLKFLDDLRESAVVNMFGACPYLEKEFGVTHDEAKTILGWWIQTFSDRQKE